MTQQQEQELLAAVRLMNAKEVGFIVATARRMTRERATRKPHLKLIVNDNNKQ